MRSTLRKHPIHTVLVQKNNCDVCRNRKRGRCYLVNYPEGSKGYVKHAYNHECKIFSRKNAELIREKIQANKRKPKGDGRSQQYARRIDESIRGAYEI